MKTISKTTSILISSMFGLFVAIPAVAQTSPPAKIDPVPPKLEKLEEGPPESGVAVGAKPEVKNKTTEKRNNGGKVTEVQVKSGKSNYVVKANPEYGNAPKGTVQGDANRGAQWSILEFGGKKEVKEGNPPDVLAPAPVKPASASSSASK